MESVIITVKRKGDLQGRDLEVPLDITAGDLLQEISRSLGWGDQYDIYVSPQERILGKQETLADAEVWDGSTLVFQSHQKTSVSVPSSMPSNTGSHLGSNPVGSWRSLKPKK